MRPSLKIACSRSACFLALMASFSGCTGSRGGEASLKVWNGESIGEEDFPAVRFFNGNCSGTFISDRVFLTAAHCLPGLRASRDKWPPRVRVKGEDKSTFQVWGNEKFVNPDVPENATSWLDMGRYDLALLVWDEPVSSAFIPLIDHEIELPTSVELVGYGGVDLGGEEAGSKHSGHGEVRSRRFDMLEIVVDRTKPPPKKGQQSTLTDGDSGGPLLIGGHLAGVASWGREHHKELLGDDHHHGFYVDLTSRIARDFISKARAAGAPIEGGMP